MHRSGTSALTGALARTGVFVGDDDELTAKSWENPAGFFERRDARKICDTLLHESGADWWKVSSFHPDNANYETVRTQRLAIRDLVKRLDEHGTWALKEPRLCLLLPIFKSALNKPLAIIAVRHPVEIARSLRRRNGFPVQAGLALWEAYTVSLLRSALAMDHLFVDYHELVRDPSGVLDHLAGELRSRGVFGLDADTGAASIQPALYRERLDEGADAGILSSSQAALWDELSGKRQWKSAPNVSDAALSVLREFEPDEAARLEARTSISTLTNKVAALQAAERESAANAKEAAQQLNDLSTRADQLKRDLEARNATVESLRGELTNRDAKLKENDNALAEIRKQLAERNERLAEQGRRVDQLRGELTARDSRASEAQAALSELRGRHDEQTKQLDAERRRVEELRRELNDRDSRLSETRSRAETLQLENVRLGVELSSKSSVLEELHGRYAEQSEELAEKDRRLAELSSELSTTLSGLKELQVRYAEQSKQLDQERAHVTDVRSELTARDSQVAELRAAIEASQRETAELGAQLSSTSSELETLRDRDAKQNERLAAEEWRVEELLGEVSARDSQVSELRTALERLENGNSEQRRRFELATHELELERKKRQALEAKSQRQRAKSQRQHERAAYLKANLHSLAEHNEEIEARLSAIEASRSWRAVSAVGRLRQRMTLRRGSLQIEATPPPEHAQSSPLPERSDDSATEPEPPSINGNNRPKSPGIQVELSEGLTNQTYDTSIIVLNRDGERHLTNLFGSYLKHHDGQTAEWVVVDHASTDGSRDVIRRFMTDLPIKLIALDRNDTFSRSNNLAARFASGTNLVFCNNDIIFDRPALGTLVGELANPDVGIVGLPLYYPQTDAQAARQLQHAGIGFRYDEEFDFPRPYNIQQLDAPGRNLEFPAVTAALMACRADVFRSSGGFHEGYNYGYEDVDLSLTIRQQLGKTVVLCGKTSAIHDESASQKQDPSDAVAKRRRGNIEMFRGRYAEHVMQRYMNLATHGIERGHKFRLGLVVTDDDPDTTAGDFFTASEIASALETAFGWICSYLPQRSQSRNWYDCGGLDGILVLIDAYDLRKIENASPNLLKIAWLRNWFDRWVAHPWFNRYDLALCSSESAGEFVAKRSAVKVDTLPIATNPGKFHAGNLGHEAFRSDYCFTGSYWNARREIEDLDPRSLPYEFALYGSGWEGHDQFSDCRRGAVPYRDIPKVYASTKIVIDDANHVTRPWGSVNSRVFDALASGALVISNGVRGAEETFAGLLPTWQGADDLAAKVRHYMEHPEERAQLTRMLHANVTSEHTYARRAQQLKAFIDDSAARRRIAIKLPVPRWEIANEWGDFHFGSALARSLEKLGYRVRLDVLPEWHAPGTETDDVVIVLRGLSRYDVRTNQLNIMWNISHPDKVHDEEYEQYDHVFVASVTLAATLDKRLQCPVSPLLQCTDPERFRFDPNGRRSDEVLFVGNSRSVMRPIVQHAIEAGIDIRVYGTRWENFIDERFIAGQHIDNAELAAAYAGSGAVLNDHWATMRESGVISNRLFDLAACGAVIVTDRVAGAHAVFGDVIYEYDDTPEGLKRCIDKALVDGDETAEAREELSRRIAREHSFDSRAREMHRLIEDKMVERRLIEPTHSPGRSLSGIRGCEAHNGLSKGRNPPERRLPLVV